LSIFAETHPHASYAAFTHGNLPKWNYYFCTTPNISNLLSPLELAIHGHFLPKLVLHPASDNEHQLFCLSVHFGGLGISNPVLTSDEQYDFSKELLRGLINLIFHQNPEDTVHHQNETYHHLSSAREKSLSDRFKSILPAVLHLCNGLSNVVWRKDLLLGFLLFP